jgi:hypothetical protein
MAWHHIIQPDPLTAGNLAALAPLGCESSFASAGHPQHLIGRMPSIEAWLPRNPGSSIPIVALHDEKPERHPNSNLLTFSFSTSRRKFFKSFVVSKARSFSE